MSNLFADRDIYDVISFLTGVIGFAMTVTPFFLRWRKRALAQDDALFEVTKRFQAYRDARAVEIRGLNDRLAAAAARLDLIDPERFLDQTDALARTGNYKDLDRTALEFFHAQVEALARATEILTEQRILDSETYGAAAAAEAQRFAIIGTTINPNAPRLKALLALSDRRAEGIARGEPIEALAMDGLTDVQLNALSISLYKKGNYVLSEIAARRSVPLVMARTGETSANAAKALSVHSTTLSSLGAYAEAESVARHVLDIDRATIGEVHPEYATRLNNLAGVVEAQGRYEEAEGLYAQALVLSRKTLGDVHPNTQLFARNFHTLITTHLPASPHLADVQAVLAARKAAPDP